MLGCFNNTDCFGKKHKRRYFQKQEVLNSVLSKSAGMYLDCKAQLCSWAMLNQRRGQAILACTQRLT